MSRSYRKNPIAGWAADSDKAWKSHNNRAKRSNLRASLKKHVATNVSIDDINDLYDEDADLDVEARSSCDNPWTWDKDGKCAMFTKSKSVNKRFDEDEWEDARDRLMRK